MDLVSAPQPMVIVARDGLFQWEDVRKLLDELYRRTQAPQPS